MSKYGEKAATICADAYQEAEWKYTEDNSLCENAVDFEGLDRDSRVELTVLQLTDKEKLKIACLYIRHLGKVSSEHVGHVVSAIIVEDYLMGESEAFHLALHSTEDKTKEAVHAFVAGEIVSPHFSF